MYSTFLSFHSIFRWLVLLSLLYAIFRAFRGYRYRLAFSAHDNHIRHWTATIAHVQLMLGVTLYGLSPLSQLFMKQPLADLKTSQTVFFGLFHPMLMLAAIVVLTVGSAKAKRKESDLDKFKTMLIYFSIALLIMLMAIPWPFSPWVARPYIS